MISATKVPEDELSRSKGSLSSLFRPKEVVLINISQSALSLDTLIEKPGYQLLIESESKTALSLVLFDITIKEALYFAKTARKLNIKTIHLLDHWTSYSERLNLNQKDFDQTGWVLRSSINAT